jgi:hypothetical protein
MNKQQKMTHNINGFALFLSFINYVGYAISYHCISLSQVNFEVQYDVVAIIE